MVYGAYGCITPTVIPEKPIVNYINHHIFIIMRLNCIIRDLSIILIFQCTLSCALANTFTVINTADSGPGSLRDAVATAVAGDTIRFDSSMDMIPITLTSGEITLNRDLVIIGNLAASSGQMTPKGIGAQGPPPATIISGNNNSRIFNISSNINIELSGVLLTGGFISNSGGAIINAGTLDIMSSTILGNTASSGGGGVLNVGTATTTFTNTTISGNSAEDDGGGVFNTGAATATFNNTTIVGNTCKGTFSDGGGVFNTGAATATFNNTTITGNTASSRGGGIFNAGTATFNNTTLAGNTTLAPNFPVNGFGGGVYNAGIAIFNGTTISGNTSIGADGGGVFNGNTATFNITTISGNTSIGADGGGVFNFFNSTATFTNTIVALNTASAGPDILSESNGNFIDGGNNLIGDGTGQSTFIDGSNGNIVGTATDPVDPLFIMNVPTAPSTGGNLRLQCGSRAINAGNNATVPFDITDSDGDMDVTERLPLDLVCESRILDGTVDIGAFEADCTPPAPIPTIGEWGIICLGLSFLIIGLVGIRSYVLSLELDSI